MFGKVAIFGVGLIGGSFALALRKAGGVQHIVGAGRSFATLERARELGIVDAITNSPEEAVREADLVLLAAPVAQTGAILSSLVPFLAPGTIITDAGSTKSDVVLAARQAMGGKINQFVPGHPIAGGERNGPDAALDNLYAGKKVVITALPENTVDAIERVAGAWRMCGASIHRLTPAEHDRVFAAVSHMPHLLAFALVDDIANKPHADLLFQFAASGFRDFTRIAGSSPEMWRDITVANREAMLVELDEYMTQLQRLRALLESQDAAGIEAIYANARRARENWLAAIEARNGAPTTRHPA